MHSRIHSKTISDSRLTRQTVYPISDRKSVKIIPFGTPHTYMAYIRGTPPPPPPWATFIELIMGNRIDKAFTVTTFEVKTV